MGNTSALTSRGRRLRGKDGELLPERAVCEAFVNEHGGSSIPLSERRQRVLTLSRPAACFHAKFASRWSLARTRSEVGTSRLPCSFSPHELVVRADSVARYVDGGCAAWNGGP